MRYSFENFKIVFQFSVSNKIIMLVRNKSLGEVNGEEGQMDSDKQGKCGNRESTEVGLSLNG